MGMGSLVELSVWDLEYSDFDLGPSCSSCSRTIEQPREIEVKSR